MRRLLLFDVLADDLDGRTAATASKVGRRPQGAAPQLLADARVVLFADHAAGHALEAAHQRRDGDLGRVVHQQVDVIVLTVELNQFRLEVGTDAGEYPVQVIEDFLGEHFAAIFGHKDQMHMHQEYAVPSLLARPKSFYYRGVFHNEGFDSLRRVARNKTWETIGRCGPAEGVDVVSLDCTARISCKEVAVVFD